MECVAHMGIYCSLHGRNMITKLKGVYVALFKNMFRQQSRQLSTAITMLVALVCVALPLQASASDAALSRIGFVDIPYLIDKAPQALEAEQRLETEFAPRQAELRSQREQLAELTARLNDNTLELPEADQIRLDRETRGLERRIKRSEQDFREELNIQKNNEFKKVRILVLEAIARFGKTHEYDLIISDGVLYANKRIDVTERILESLVQENLRLQSSN